ncbi:2-dehydropantoate 2-reductase [Pleurostoma richardsiae]|uniref:2-dehydropantoate 2-reductase n=1 Tax=Pleurostoma richardsiae TaxID=41990 RepID=A0AA38RGV8_9PEZI|nr:2-dehydropantoate 2-reductase [Pleurostoma richardsiae]
MTSKAKVLLVGCGGVGTIAALNLELGGLATVDAVLRSNFQAVSAGGFTITSTDHGKIVGWRPTRILRSVPNIQQDNLEPYDFIVVTTKNIPDVTPTVLDIVGPAISLGHTVIVLIQNGLNIEKPFLGAFPQNVVLSGISIIGSHETDLGVIEHDGHDSLEIGPFRNPNLDHSVQETAAKRFISIYNAAGKSTCTYDPKVGRGRWRKLVYNACLNPICAITGLDTGRLRLAEDTVETLVRPAMGEIMAAAKAAGETLPENIAETMITLDPLQMYYSPSMLEDVRKGNFIEYENIIGEPVRAGKELGVPMPTLSIVFSMCKAIQWRNKQRRGLIDIPPREAAS